MTVVQTITQEQVDAVWTSACAAQRRHAKLDARIRHNIAVSRKLFQDAHSGGPKGRQQRYDRAMAREAELAESTRSLREAAALEISSARHGFKEHARLLRLYRQQEESFPKALDRIARTMI